MKYTALILLLAASTVAATAQTPAKSATTGAKSATPAAKMTATEAALPEGIPAIKATEKPLFTATLRYQDEVVGTGTEAEAGKLLKFQFTMWTAKGVKIDSSLDHAGQPLKDKDGKPVLGDDGKPKLGDPQPGTAIMGSGRPFPGWDLGFEGMKQGGKRRLFVPWQLGLGNREIPSRSPSQPAIPAKSDLIIDVNLIEVADAPKPPARPTMGGPGMHPMAPGQGMPGTAAKPETTAAPGAAPAATAPAAAPATPATAPAATPAATPAQPQSK
jgi:peptidylprolyl isomerase